jgi:hypothetical protein
MKNIKSIKRGHSVQSGIDESMQRLWMNEETYGTAINMFGPVKHAEKSTKIGRRVLGKTARQTLSS